MQHLAALERRARIRGALCAVVRRHRRLALHIGRKSPPLGMLLLALFAFTQCRVCCGSCVCVACCAPET